MLILPIAQENSTVRRTPWVSYVVIGLNFGVFLLVLLAADPDVRQREFRRRLYEAWSFAAERPYLEAPAGLTRLLNDRGADELARHRAARAASPLPLPTTIETERAEMQALAERLEA